MWQIAEERTGLWLLHGEGYEAVPFARLTPWPADRDLEAAAADVECGEVARISGTIFAAGIGDGRHEFYTTMF